MLRLVRNVLICVLLATLSGVAVCACMLLRSTAMAVNATAATVATLPAEIHGAREELLASLDYHLTALQNSAAGAIRDQGNQLNASVARVASMAEGIQQDLRPALEALPPAVAQISGATTRTLGGVDALTADADKTVVDLRDSWDTLWPDVQGTTASATVAVTGLARAAEAVGNAAPSVAASVDGIAQAARREADEFTKPRTLRQKIADWLGMIPLIIKLIL